MSDASISNKCLRVVLGGIFFIEVSAIFNIGSNKPNVHNMKSNGP